MTTSACKSSEKRICDASTEELEEELGLRRAARKRTTDDAICCQPLRAPRQRQHHDQRMRSGLKIIPSRCLDRATCFCTPYEYRSTPPCQECNGKIYTGDCVKFSSNGKGRVHVQCPGSDKPLLRGFCEKQSKYERCKCAPAQKLFVCSNCNDPIEIGHCIPYKPTQTNPVHTRCHRLRDAAAELTTGVTPRSVADIFDDPYASMDVDERTARRRLHFSPPPRRLGIGSVMFHEPTRTYYEIRELFVKEESSTRETFAVCNLFVKLEDTLIGRKEAETLQMNGYPSQFARFQGQETIALHQLQSTDLTPEHIQTQLTWDPIKKGGGGEHQWTFAFYNARSDKTINLQQKPVIMDFFAGAGGVHLGFHKLGFPVKYSVEKDKAAATTLRRNSDIGSVVYEEDANALLSKLKSGIHDGTEFPRPGEVDIFHASPPCQGHSSANPNGGQKEEQNNDLTLDTLEYVKYLLPKVFTFENVMGIVEKDAKGNAKSSLEIFQELVAGLLSLGYQVRATAVNAKDYGDPQSRSRVILIAVQNGYVLPLMPRPTHGPGADKPYVTVRGAIEDFEAFDPDHTTGEIAIGGRSVTNHTLLGPENAKKLPAYVVECKTWLDADKPSPTIKCSNPVGHYNKKRFLTPRERARLQGFPDNFIFYGTYLEQCRQIGNAVSIGLAKAMASAALECFRFPRDAEQ